ncbi:MAG: hypothetical protein ACRDTV_22015, partial [Mycobacterium sp.]
DHQPNQHYRTENSATAHVGLHCVVGAILCVVGAILRKWLTREGKYANILITDVRPIAPLGGL